MSISTLHWYLYILDDKVARHALMPDLVTCVNAEAANQNLPHTFSNGFADHKVPNIIALNKALDDHMGIWLIDLDIPLLHFADSIELFGDAPAPGTHAGLQLAYRVINVLRSKRRPFLVISSGSLSGGETQDAMQAININVNDGVRFDAAEHIPGMVQALIALTVPKHVYPRAFNDAQKKLAEPIYHTREGTKAGRAMFAPSDDDETEPVHKLSEWDALYPPGTSLPVEVTNALNTIFPKLFREWNLDLSGLAHYPVLQRADNWALPAAKAVNGDSIHRAFLFGLPPAAVTQACLPSVRKMICARNPQKHPVALGVLALKTLLGTNNGFQPTELSVWQAESEEGVQLLLTSTVSGCDGVSPFKEVLNDPNWQPPANPNRAETRRLLKQVRDTFFTDGSSVTCESGKVVLTLRFKEKPLD